MRQQSRPVRIVQVTDPHLFRSRDGVLAGVATWETFETVLRQVARRHGDFDWLILTGDLAQDESAQTYTLLREALGDWLPRCRLIPGNHDDPGHLRATFPAGFAGDTGSLAFALACGGWRILGLDSRVDGDIHGRVGAAQLDWLRRQLASHATSPTAVFIHHPPLPIEVPWLDAHGLHDAGGLVSLIAASPQVRLVCAGHVHQPWQGRIAAATVYTTPSTCVQFGARKHRSFDRSGAGYRTLALAPDGSHTTAVHRLAAGSVADSV